MFHHKNECTKLVFFFKDKENKFCKKKLFCYEWIIFMHFNYIPIFFMPIFFFNLFYQKKKRFNLCQFLDKINYPNLSCHNQLYSKHTQGGRTLKTSWPQYSLIGATLSSGSILAMPRSFLGVLLDNTKWEPLGRPKTSLEF